MNVSTLAYRVRTVPLSDVRPGGWALIAVPRGSDGSFDDESVVLVYANSNPTVQLVIAGGR